MGTCFESYFVVVSGFLFVLLFLSLPFLSLFKESFPHKSKALQKIHAKKYIYNTLATDNRGKGWAVGGHGVETDFGR